MSLTHWPHPNPWRVWTLVISRLATGQAQFGASIRVFTITLGHWAEDKRSRSEVTTTLRKQTGSCERLRKLDNLKIELGFFFESFVLYASWRVENFLIIIVVVVVRNWYNAYPDTTSKFCEKQKKIILLNLHRTHFRRIPRSRDVTIVNKPRIPTF